MRLTRKHPTGVALHIARVIVAVAAAAELRCLIVAALRVDHARLPASLPLGSETFWASALLAAGAVVLLREISRGLTPPRPRRSARLAITWACCSAALLGVLCVRGLGGAGFASGLPSVAVALCIGLLLAASLQGTRWMLRAVASLAPRARTRAHSHAPMAVVAWARAGSPPAPLLAGWSDRGPPSPLV